MRPLGPLCLSPGPLQHCLHHLNPSIHLESLHRPVAVRLPRGHLDDMRAMIAAASDLVQGSEPSLVVRVLIVILICTLIAVLCGRMQQQWQQRQLRHAALALLKLHSQTATQSLNAASPLADRQTSHSITQRALASAIAELKAAAAAEDATAEDVGQQHAEERTYSELNV